MQNPVVGAGSPHSRQASVLGASLNGKLVVDTRSYLAVAGLVLLGFE